MSRRSFLAASAATAAGFALGGCGGGGGGGDDYVLVSFFPRQGLYVTGFPQRLPFGLGDAEGVVLADTPESLELTFTPEAGGPPVAATVNRRGNDGTIVRAYYPAEVTFPTAGIWNVTGRAGGSDLVGALAIVGPDEVAVPKPGEALAPIVTPTVGAPGDVDPLCTRQPACPLHEVSLDAVLGKGKAVALLVATPAFCRTAICGPVLDVLLSVRAEYADRVEFIHAEVYTDDTGKTPTAVMGAYSLLYEPVLFVADAAGVLRRRLDVIYDTAEVREALDAALGA